MTAVVSPGTPMPFVLAELRDLLSERLVAYLAGATETRVVNDWASGVRSICNPQVEARLRYALQVASMLAEYDDPPVVQAWFVGLNPQLGNRSPARMLREGELDQVGPLVMRATRALIDCG